MNLLEVYLEEIHSVEPYTAEWVKEFPDREFVEVDVTTNSYGSIRRSKHVWTTTEFEKYKEQGYYMG
jgi:hypothetical protein